MGTHGAVLQQIDEHGHLQQTLNLKHKNNEIWNLNEISGTDEETDEPWADEIGNEVQGSSNNNNADGNSNILESNNKGTSKHRYHPPTSQEFALKNLDHWISFKYRFLHQESSFKGNLMDLKRFLTVVITDFILFKKNQHEDKLPDFPQLFQRSIAHVMLYHGGKPSKDGNHLPKISPYGGVVERSTATKPCGHGTELIWKVKELEVKKHIQELVKMKPASLVSTKESQFNGAGYFCSWTPGDVKSYVEEWTKAINMEMEANIKKEMKEITKGKVLHNSGQFLTVGVSSDFLLKCGWDRNDYVVVSVAQQFDEGQVAIIKKIVFPADSASEDDFSTDCVVTLKCTNNGHVTASLAEVITIQKQTSTEIHHKWIVALNFFEGQIIPGATRCVILNEPSKKIRTDAAVEEIVTRSWSTLGRLNDTQLQVLKKALQQEFTILMGHPGTGKTQWICALLHTLGQMPDVGKVLVTGATNAAINVVCSTFLQTYNPDTHLIARPCPPQIEIPVELEAFRRTDEDLTKSKFIFCTCVHSVCGLLQAMNFDVVIVDEASQMTEPDLLCGLAGRSPTQLILVGDPFQNSPVSQSQHTLLKQSALERLFRQGAPVQKLKDQYRMLPQLADIARQFIYEEYNDTLVASQQTPLDIPLWKDHPCWFLQISSAELKDISGACFNYATSRNIAQVVDHLVSNNFLKGDQIGIVDGYRLDKIVLENLIKDYATKRFGKHKSIEDSEHMKVSVNTVDGFQGGQKDFIILATVRSNSHNKIGFMSNLQRFNVATTRARKGLLIVGDFFTFYESVCPVWQKLLYDLATANPPRIIDGVNEFKQQLFVARKTNQTQKDTLKPVAGQKNKRSDNNSSQEKRYSTEERTPSHYENSKRHKSYHQQQYPHHQRHQDYRHHQDYEHRQDYHHQQDYQDYEHHQRHQDYQHYQDYEYYYLPEYHPNDNYDRDHYSSYDRDDYHHSYYDRDNPQRRDHHRPSSSSYNTSNRRHYG